ncbi:MAG TPA: oligosaccharide flippase family protein [Blastocatellia bacterium]|nr:oligosaccharide flippase family protein [Blastocatellia bacterium]
MQVNGVTATIYGKIKKTVKHTLIFGIGSVVNSAFGLILVPLYTRYLRAAEFGVLSLLTITLTLITIVLKFGLNHAFFRHYYDTEDPVHRRRIVGSTLAFLLVSSLLSTGLLYLVAPQVSWLVFSGDASNAGLLRLIFFISFFEIISVIPDSILRANFKSAHYSALNITAFAVQLAVICYLVIFVDPSVESVLRGRLIGSAFEAVIFFFVVRRDLSLNFSSAELRGMLAFGTPLIFNQIAMTLFMMIDRFFLERYGKARDVGVYAIANTLVSVVSVLATVPFSQVWTVMRFSVMNEEGADEYYSRVLTYITFVSMFLSLGVAAVAGDGLLRFARSDYWPAAGIIPLLALAMVLDSAARVLNIGITLKKRTVYAPITIAAALAFNIALNFALIPRYGSWGAAVSTLLSYVAFCGLRYWASNRFYKVHYEWRRVFTVGVVGALIAAAFYAIDYLRGDLNALSYDDPHRRRMIYVSAAMKVALALAFPLILLALGFYDERERRRLADIWQQSLGALSNRKPADKSSADADDLPISAEESFDAGD